MDAIDRSPDPVGTAFNGLFKHNGVDVHTIEKNKIEAGVKMYPRMEEEHLMPQNLLSFVKQFYGDHESLQINEIIVQKMKRYHGGVESYDPYIMIEVEVGEETASELEKKTGEVLSPKGNQIGGRVIHLNPKEGRWKASAVVWDSADIDKEELPRGTMEVPEFDVDISLIRSIAKMVPINPRGGPALERVIAIAPTH